MASSKDVALIEKLRTWRRDASSLHQYEAAAFVGDKILSITKDVSDAFWLAHIYFHIQSYARAHALLTKPNYLESSYDCRYLAALCLVKQSKWEEALDLLDESVLLAASKSSIKTNENMTIGASLTYLRGVIHMNQNNFDRAKEFFLKAVQIDARCYQAYDQLITNSLLDPDEGTLQPHSQPPLTIELALLNNLDFQGIPAECRDFIRLVYLTKLNKYKHSNLFTDAERLLTETYNLKENADLLLSKANLHFVSRQYTKCLDTTTEILRLDPFQIAALPNHLCCLYQLKQKNKLFLLAHNLADSAPEQPTTWFGVGVYYLSVGKVAEARRYFSKSSMMDPHFGPAWIGFAHSFAAEGEHEQAISAYTTAARLFQGTHLPLLFLGMQHLQLNNLQLAEEYLLQAHGICDNDPLLLNEIGVAAFEKSRFTEAVHYFKEAIRVAELGEWDQEAWTVAWTNLGHAYRKMGQMLQAHSAFARAIKLNNRDAGVCTSYALVCMILGDINSAITSLHEALTISPADQIANELMTRALLANSELSFEMTPDLTLDAETNALLEDTDQLLEVRKQNLAVQEGKKKVVGRTSRLARKLRFSQEEEEDEEDMDTN